METIIAGEKVLLRRMEADDIPAAVVIEEAAYRQPWSAQVFADELAQPSRTYMVAEVDGEMAGFGGVMAVGDEAHITSIVIDPARRGGLIGTRLMLGLIEAALLGGAGSLTLEVRSSNTAAQALYRRFGMAPVGVRKQYYKDEDALIMWAHEIDGDEYRARLDEIRSSLQGDAS